MQPQTGRELILDAKNSIQHEEAIIIFEAAVVDVIITRGLGLDDAIFLLSDDGDEWNIIEPGTTTSAPDAFDKAMRGI